MTKNPSIDPRQVLANLETIRRNVETAVHSCGRDPKEIIIQAVTKTVSPELVNVAIDNGIHVIGENRVQELLAKYELYHKENLRIHFIGHLQSNKIKYIIDKVDMIESVDSFALAEKISAAACKRGKVCDILLEVNIGKEASKSGFAPEEILYEIEKISSLPGIKIRGLMAIPPKIEKKGENNTFFSNMRHLFLDIEAKKLDNVSMEFLSMGMSDDYADAVTCGANLIRIGSALFGKRL